MKTIGLKKTVSILAAFVLAAGVFLYVDAKDNSVGAKKAQTELVYFQFDSNENPIPIPTENLDDSTHEQGANPYACPDEDGKMCSAGYDRDELEQNSAGDWVPGAAATQYDTKRYLN